MSTISVESRHLAVVEDGHEVLWQYQMDLSAVLHRGTRSGIDVPSTAEGGFVLVGLDVDGEGYDVVQTDSLGGVGGLRGEQPRHHRQGHHGPDDSGAWHQGRRGAVVTAVTHRAWCNSHVDDEDGPGLCSRESEAAPSFGIDVTEDDDGLAVDLWHPMRPGQDRRSFTAAELRAIAAELLAAAELVDAEGGEPKA